MGYRGLVQEQARARELRSQGWKVQDIATELGVAKSSVSLWVRDVEFVVPPARRRYDVRRVPNKLQRAKQAEIDELLEAGRRSIGRMTEQEFLIAGTALYAGEGSKTPGEVRFSNSDPRMIHFFCAWFRHFFVPDELRLRFRVYLHEGLDLEETHRYWSALTGIPIEQFGKPYRAVADPSIRKTKHAHGCAYVGYCSTRTHREVMGLVHALLSCDAFPSGVAQPAEQGTVNAKAVGSSPTPGASPKAPSS